VKIKSQSYGRGGFTLLEVMVALTILGLGVVTLLQIFSMGLRLGARSAEHTTAVTSGARVMDELLARKKLVEGSQSGTLGADGRWNAQVQAVRDSQTELVLSSPWALKEVSLEVTVIEAGRERRVDLKTLRLIQKGISEP
jgi:prepilin-type N-terminal cleavage/methylation domain-containing protein